MAECPKAWAPSPSPDSRTSAAPTDYPGLVTPGIQTSTFPPGNREAYQPTVDTQHFSCPALPNSTQQEDPAGSLASLVSELSRGLNWANQSPP